MFSANLLHEGRENLTETALQFQPRLDPTLGVFIGANFF